MGVRTVSSGEDNVEDEVEDVSEDADGDTVLLIESDV